MLELSGLKFGRWVVKHEDMREALYARHWVCECSCGSVKSVLQSSLRSGKSTSCGCYQKEAVSAANYRHGSHEFKEYKVWSGMKQRCYNTNEKCYKNYGGRGIVVCDRWLSSFRNFLLDMGSRPNDTYSIERLDNDGDYSRSNCKWGTSVEQARNKRTNRKVTFNGSTMLLVEWSELFGIEITALWKRLNRSTSVDVAFRGLKPITEVN